MRSPGVSDASRVASSIAGWCENPLAVWAKAKRRICVAAASANSGRPWPMLTHHSPDVPSSISRPSASFSVAPLADSTITGPVRAC